MKGCEGATLIPAGLRYTNVTVLLYHPQDSCNPVDPCGKSWPIQRGALTEKRLLHQGKFPPRISSPGRAHCPLPLHLRDTLPPCPLPFQCIGPSSILHGIHAPSSHSTTCSPPPSPYPRLSTGSRAAPHPKRTAPLPPTNIIYHQGSCHSQPSYPPARHPAAPAFSAAVPPRPHNRAASSQLFLR